MRVIHASVAIVLVVIAASMALRQHWEIERLELALDSALVGRTSSESLDKSTVAFLNNRIAALQQQVESLQQQLANAQASQPANFVSSPTSTTPQGTASQVSASSVAAITGAAINSPESRARIRDAMVVTEYGEFIAALKLSDQDAAHVRDLISAVAAKSTERADRIARGEISREEATVAASTELANALAGFLSREEMEVFYDYEAARPARARSRTAAFTRPMVAQYAPGLTEENIALVADTVAAAIHSIPLATNVTTNGSSPIEEAYQLAEQALEGKLDASQMKLAHQYFEYRRRSTVPIVR